MILKTYRSGETGLEWYATDASWAPGCQAEDEWLLEAWERMDPARPRAILWSSTFSRPNWTCSFIMGDVV